MTICPFAADAARLTYDVREWGITTTPLESVTVWHESLGALGRAISRSADFRPGDDRPHSNHPGMSRFAKTGRKRDNMTTPQKGNPIG